MIDYKTRVEFLVLPFTILVQQRIVEKGAL